VAAVSAPVPAFVIATWVPPFSAQILKSFGEHAIRRYTDGGATWTKTVFETFSPYLRGSIVFSDQSRNRYASALPLVERLLLGLLCRCAWETLKEMHQGAFPEEDVRGAAVIAVQTAGDQLGWHPHLHALVPDAVWTREGRRLPISYLDPDAMTRSFQAKVLGMLVDERCLSPEFAARLLTWRHSGFQVYRAESVDPDDRWALERLCAYIGRAVFASSRIEYDPSSGAVHYRTAKGAQLSLDTLEWIALVTQHVPDPGEHTRHYFGWYSNVARGKGRQLVAGGATVTATPLTAGESSLSDDFDTEDFRRECRRSWPRLIQDPGTSRALGPAGPSSSSAVRPAQNRDLERPAVRERPHGLSALPWPSPTGDMPMLSLHGRPDSDSRLRIRAAWCWPANFKEPQRALSGSPSSATLRGGPTEAFSNGRSSTESSRLPEECMLGSFGCCSLAGALT
jgi:hypothetical protein